MSGLGRADPRATLLERLAARRAAEARADARDAALGWARLAAFVVVLGAAWLAFAAHRLAPAWLLAPGAAFLALVLWHDRIRRARGRLRRAVAFHEAALARVEERWVGQGNAGARFAAEEHLAAADLDLFGHGSLFELLCAARTAPGEARLAAWLREPAAAGEVRARQEAVASLAPRLDLREELALLGEDLRAEVDAPSLVRWAEAPPHLAGWTGPAATGLAAATVLALAVGAAGWASFVPALLLLGVEAVFVRALAVRLGGALGGVTRPARELEVLALLLGRLEAEPLGAPWLAARRAALLEGGRAASARIARLGRTVARLEWAQNQLFAPLGAVLLWRLHHAVAIERWRAADGAAVGRWLDAVADLEALGSLAGYAWEHPDDPFPELLEHGDGEARLEGAALRHPLLPAASCVANDVRLGPGRRVLLVSGSNMSGKSTYLRTVGVNVTLALCGAPVRAARLALTPLRAGATLRIQDSLLEGRSRFFAEITRLKALLDVAGRGPRLLFLLDEILHGTNSQDRRVGAEAILRAFLARGAIGLVTTHDLALTALVEGGAPIANAHFEDAVVDGQVAFDYRLRDGVVGRSNALALMRAVGLPVD